METVISVVYTNPEILGGEPVFFGSRVPVRTLFDYLAAGDSLAKFVDHFPTVSREHAILVLDQAKELLVANAHSA